MIKSMIACSVDSDEPARSELSHPDLHCLQVIFVFHIKKISSSFYKWTAVSILMIWARIHQTFLGIEISYLKI